MYFIVLDISCNGYTKYTCSVGSVICFLYGKGYLVDTIDTQVLFSFG